MLNFRSTVPSLSTALCLCQLLSTVSEKGGNPAAFREQMGQSRASSHFYCLVLVIFFGALLIFNLFSIPIKTFPESGVGDGQRRKGAREQIQ